MSEAVESGDNEAPTVDDEESAEFASKGETVLWLRASGSVSTIGGSGMRLGSHSPFAYAVINECQSSTSSASGGWMPDVAGADPCPPRTSKGGGFGDREGNREGSIVGMGEGFREGAGDVAGRSGPVSAVGVGAVEGREMRPAHISTDYVHSLG